MLQVLIFIILHFMNCVIWNIRGCGSNQSLLLVKDLIKLHNLSLFALVETKVGSDRAHKYAARFRGWSFHCIEPVGVSGGIWLF